MHILTTLTWHLLRIGDYCFFDNSIVGRLLILWDLHLCIWSDCLCDPWYRSSNVEKWVFIDAVWHEFNQLKEKKGKENGKNMYHIMFCHDSVLFFFKFQRENVKQNINKFINIDDFPQHASTCMGEFVWKANLHILRSAILDNLPQR